jgi:hypothetical protein
MFGAINQSTGLGGRLDYGAVRLAVTVILASVLATPLLAQAGSVVARGSRVRVVLAPVAPGRQEQRVEGTLLRASDDSIVLLTGPALSDTSAYVLWQQGTLYPRLELKHGSRGHAGTGAVVGFLVGVVGSVYENARRPSVDEKCGSDDLCRGLYNFGEAFNSPILVGIGGALYGGIIGALIRTDNWETVNLRGVRIAITPRGAVIRIAL